LSNPLLRLKRRIYTAGKSIHRGLGFRLVLLVAQLCSRSPFPSSSGSRAMLVSRPSIAAIRC